MLGRELDAPGEPRITRVSAHFGHAQDAGIFDFPKRNSVPRPGGVSAARRYSENAWRRFLPACKRSHQPPLGTSFNKHGERLHGAAQPQALSPTDVPHATCLKPLSPPLHVRSTRPIGPPPSHSPTTVLPAGAAGREPANTVSCRGARSAPRPPAPPCGPCPPHGPGTPWRAAPAVVSGATVRRAIARGSKWWQVNLTPAFSFTFTPTHRHTFTPSHRHPHPKHKHVVASSR